MLRLGKNFPKFGDWKGEKDAKPQSDISGQKLTNFIRAERLLILVKYLAKKLSDVPLPVVKKLEFYTFRNLGLLLSSFFQPIS